MAYDYIVIGSGFGGSVASLRLVEKGYKVLTIEQGKRYNPSDFPKTNWNLPKYLWVPSLRFFGFQKLSFYTTASILSGTGVGGGSLVYANTLYIPKDEFFSNSSWARFGNWKKILEPFYTRASFMLGRKKYTRLNVEDLALEAVSKEMNAHDTFETVYVGVNLDGGEEECDPYFGGLGPMRKGCTECGGCMVGCRENAKNTLDRNYLWFAEKLGLEIIPETKAEKITFKHPVKFLRTVFNFRWSSRMVIFLTMQTVDNAMRMVWRNGMFGGKMKIDNSGQKKVPAYIPVGQEVMERYAMSKIPGKKML